MLASIAGRYSSVVVLENLNHPRINTGGSRRLNERLSLWFYRRMWFVIAYEAPWRRLGLSW